MPDSGRKVQLRSITMSGNNMKTQTSIITFLLVTLVTGCGVKKEDHQRVLTELDETKQALLLSQDELLSAYSQLSDLMAEIVSLKTAAVEEKQDEYGIFKRNWNKAPADHHIAVSYRAMGSMPDSDKEKLKSLIRSLDKEINNPARLTNRSWDKNISAVESDINKILRTYEVSLPDALSSRVITTSSAKYSNSRSIYNERVDFYTKALKGPVKVNKSAQVKIPSLEFKYINSESGENKNETMHFCAVKVDIDWQGVPSEVKGVNFSIFFYDGDGLEVAREIFIIIRDDVVSEKVTIAADRSHGEPVRFEIKPLGAYGRY